MEWKEARNNYRKVKLWDEWGRTIVDRTESTQK